MTNNGRGYEGHRVCHLQNTRGGDDRTSQWFKRHFLNNFFFCPKYLFPGLMEVPVVTMLIAQYLILHLSWQNSYGRYDQNNISNLHPISKGFDCDSGRYCEGKNCRCRDPLLRIHFLGSQFLALALINLILNLAKSLDKVMKFLVLCSVSDFSRYNQQVTDRKAVHLVNGRRDVLWFLARKWSIVIGRHFQHF